MFPQFHCVLRQKGLTIWYSIYMLYHMKTEKLKQLENEIRRIKKELSRLGPMRPGNLSLQYKTPGEKKGPYYQLSYTHKMKSRTQYVRLGWVNDIRGQIEIYKRFRKLIEEWIDLSIEHSQTRMKQAKESKGNET
jgi:hypothetical protein